MRYASLQWGHDLSVMDTCQLRGRRCDTHPFNGAMTFRSWILTAGRATAFRGTVLQWGHDLSVMDTGITIGNKALPHILQWGHDLSVMDTCAHGLTASRALCLQWGHDLSVMDTASVSMCQPSRYWAFNGAMTFRSWIPARSKFTPSASYTLQWGHDLSVMDTQSTAAEEAAAFDLQWGHDLSVMDTAGWRIICAPMTCCLQWGHDLSVMDTPFPIAPCATV